MTRRLLCFLVFAAAALLLLLPATAARAQGVPELAESGELVLVEPGVVPGPALSVGEFTADERGVALAVGDEGERDQNYWLPEHEAALVGDGFVRFRFAAGKRLDSTILVRVQVDPADPKGLSGYGISIERDTVHLYRWDDGVALPLGESVKVKALKGKDAATVEGAIWMIGPHLSVQLYDGDSLVPLASLVVSDQTYASGRVGLRSYGKQDADTRLTFLSVRPAGLKTGQRESPIGHTRFVELAADALPDLPDLADATVIERDLEGGRVLVEVSRRGLELVRRAGVAVERVHLTPVYRFTDASFRDARARGLEPTARGFRTDRSYKDPAMVEALLRGYHERYPELTRLVEIGRSHGDRPILALKISDHASEDEDEPAVLLNGAHHGVELLSTEFVVDAIAVLLEDYEDDAEVRRQVDGLEIWCVPLVNPDGNASHIDQALYSGRKNGRDTNGNGRFDASDGVDLNRNYPFRWAALGEKGSNSDRRHNWYRGPRPGSEPETQAVMRLADSEHFAASISFHTWGTVILSPYTIDEVDNPQPDEAWAIAEAMAARAAEQPNGRLYKVKKQIYSVDGVDQDWLRFAHGTVAMLVEGVFHNPGDDKRLAAITANRGTWQALLDRVLSGPGISGTVLDAQGQPVVAAVRIEEIEAREGEHWTSRCRDGRFDRQLPGPGTWTVVAEVPGLEPVRERVSVREGQRKRVELRFDAAIDSSATSAAPLGARLCPDPAMCAVQTRILAEQGECIAPDSAPTHCIIDGATLAAGARDESGCGECRPARLALEWSPREPGTECAAAFCADGSVHEAASCSASGACVAGRATSCAPYAACDADGKRCAQTCRSDSECTEGFLCAAGTCAALAMASLAGDGAGSPAPAGGGGAAARRETREREAQTEEEEGGCSVAGGVRGSRASGARPWGWLALGVLLLLAAYQYFGPRARAIACTRK